MSYMQQLYEMAIDRKKALSKLEDKSDTYFTHIMKILIYKNTTGNAFHWIREIAGVLNDVNDIIPKAGYKLSKKDYEDNFLLAYGDNLRDFEIVLDDTFKKNMMKKYPKFNITPNLILLTYNTMTDLAEYFSPILSTKNEYTKEKFQQKLIEYFGDIL